MPILKKARHEAFARGSGEGRSARAGYRAAGYKAKDAAVDAAASRLLRNAKVAARTAELKGDAARASTITAARVLDELAKLAFSNMLNYMTIGADGESRFEFSALSRDQAAAIHELLVETRTEE